jgi:hypothetical protein
MLLDVLLGRAQGRPRSEPACKQGRRGAPASEVNLSSASLKGCSRSWRRRSIISDSTVAVGSSVTPMVAADGSTGRPSCATVSSTLGEALLVLR